MLGFLYNLIINPLVTIISLFYNCIFKISNNHILSIVILSVLINTLVLPLYIKADNLQRIEQNKQKSMSKWTKHINKVFKGDERFFRLQAYYREQNYKPIYGLKSSISLLLQIPFFAAAYTFFTSYNIFDGVKVVLIENLGKPDAIITINGFTINILPIIMTIINIFSTIVYTKGFSIKERIHSFVLPIVFFIILYNSPSGLVIYWTCNNLYSLFKNIISKLTEKSSNNHTSYNKENLDSFLVKDSRYRIIFILSLIIYVLVLGLIIPIMVIDSSPTEFQQFSYTPWYIIKHTLIFYIGVGLWWSVFYFLSDIKTQKIFSIVFCIYSLLSFACFIFFGNNFGNITTTLEYEQQMFYKSYDYLNGFSMLLLIILLVFILKDLNIVLGKHKIYIFNSLLTAFVITLMFVSAYRFYSIENRLNDIKKSEYGSEQATPVFKLSKNGKNVMIFMMDCTQGVYLPYIFNKFPELKEKYDGFTYYPNVISFGSHTITGSNGIFGGYDYVPPELNKNKEKTLKVKTYEALSTLPILFNEANYNITVLDYYNDTVNLNNVMWDDFPYVSAYELDYNYNYKLALKGNGSKKLQEEKFVRYAFMRSVPAVFQNFIYNDGNYHLNTPQIYKPRFLREISKLFSLPEYTSIVDDESNNFITMINVTSHDTAILSYPEYEPTMSLNELADDSIEYINDYGETIKGNACIDSNIAMFIQFSKYLDFLRKNDVFDNTRIIIVSDHGRGGYFDTPTEYKYCDDNGRQSWIRTQCFIPILMVKDFNSNSFKIDDTFMTNADTPWISINGIIDNAKNPWTGSLINDNYKNENEVLSILPIYATGINDKKAKSKMKSMEYIDNIYIGREWQATSDLRLKTSDSKDWATVTIKSNTNVYDPKNWAVDLDRIYKYNQKFNDTVLEED